MTTATLDLDRLVLKHGSHTSRADGVCIMEAVAWYAGKPHSDMPPCVSPVLRAMVKHYETSDTFAAVRALRDSQLDAAIDLYDRMIHVADVAVPA